MKILLVADLEGISLLDDWRAMWPEHTAPYAAARWEMTLDVNAAIRGLREAGATEITVADGHGARLWPDSFNVIPEELEPGAQLVRGISVLDGSADFDALAMVGMHCRNGTPVGFLGHTVSGFTAARFNGEWFGESEMVAAMAGHHAIPTIMVCGDDATIREACHFMPWIEGVVVKVATGRASCDCLPAHVTRSHIETAAGRALQNLSQMQPFLIPPPITAEVHFPSPAHASQAESIPRAVRSSQTSLVYVADDFPEAYRFFTTALRLASAVRTAATLQFLTSDEATATRLADYKLRRSEDFWGGEPWIVVELPPEES